MTTSERDGVAAATKRKDTGLCALFTVRRRLESLSMGGTGEQRMTGLFSAWQCRRVTFVNFQVPGPLLYKLDPTMVLPKYGVSPTSMGTQAPPSDCIKRDPLTDRHPPSSHTHHS